MTRAYVGLGSNIAPERNVRGAVRLLAQTCRVVGLSTFRRTEAIPPTGPPFVNGVVALETDLAPRALVHVLHEIETRLGRVRSSDKNAPRTIDLDLLLLGDHVAPEVLERSFVAEALRELDPSLTLPGPRVRLADVVSRMPPHPAEALPELTNALRRELKETRDG